MVRDLHRLLSAKVVGVLILVQLDGKGSHGKRTQQNVGIVLILVQLDGEGSLWETMF